jgi:hypothetical protein
LESLAPLLLLACPVGMGLMMWFMAKGMRGSSDAADAPRSLAELRREQERLDAEIRRLEQDDAREAASARDDVATHSVGGR